MPGIGLLLGAFGLAGAGVDSIKAKNREYLDIDWAKERGSNVVRSYVGNGYYAYWLWDGTPVHVKDFYGLEYAENQSLGFYAFSNTNQFNHEQKLKELDAYNKLYNKNKDFYILGNPRDKCNIKVKTNGKWEWTVTIKTIEDSVFRCLNRQVVSVDPLTGDFNPDTLDPDFLERLRRGLAAAYIEGNCLQDLAHVGSPRTDILIKEDGFRAFDINTSSYSYGVSEETRAYWKMQKIEQMERIREIANSLPKGARLYTLEDEPVKPGKKKKDSPYWTTTDSDDVTWEFLVRKASTWGLPEKYSDSSYRLYTKNSKNILKWQVVYLPFMPYFYTIQEAQKWANYRTKQHAITSYWVKDIDESEIGGK